MTAALRIEQLVVEYPGRLGPLRVLDGLDLEVESGEILALVGPSGCGKTTLLAAIMGLVRASSGSIEHRARNRALVFQKPQLFPWKNVIDNAAYGLECKGLSLPEARKRAADLLARMKLGDHLGDRPHQLSEGMQQRVNLARALLVEPDLLLMDEPFAALDILTRQSLENDLLATWNARSFTVLFASHSLEEVVVLADRVAALSDKPTRLRQVVEIGLPRPRAVTREDRLALSARALELRELLS